MLKTVAVIFNSLGASCTRHCEGTGVWYETSAMLCSAGRRLGSNVTQIAACEAPQPNNWESESYARFEKYGLLFCAGRNWRREVTKELVTRFTQCNSWKGSTQFGLFNKVFWAWEKRGARYGNYEMCFCVESSWYIEMPYRFIQYNSLIGSSQLPFSVHVPCTTTKNFRWGQ